MLEWSRRLRESQWPALRHAAALLTLGAAVIHLAGAPAHLQEYLPLGLFFIAAGILQVALAAAILTVPARRLCAGGAAGTLGVVVLWTIARAVGPAGGSPEQVGIPDVICTTMEVASALLLLVLAVRRPRSGVRRRWPVALATGPAFLLVLLLTAAGADAAGNGRPVAFNAGPAVAGRPSISVATLTEAPGTQPIKSFTLTARVARVGGRQAWTYDGTVPGPELRVSVGDRIKVTLVNRLPGATSIHWHGVRLPNAEDGVAGITQDAVRPGHSLTYEFVARDAGTYWYHSHQDTGNQLGRGLFGALVVEPPLGRLAEDHDYTVTIHQLPGSGAVAMNGSTGDLRLPASPGQTIRLRILNAVVPGMDGGPEAPVLLGAPYRVVALDGHDLNGARLLGPERLPLGMGQRADLVFTMPARGGVRLVDSSVQGTGTGVEKAVGAASKPGPAASVTIGDGPAPKADNLARLPAFDLTRYGTPAPDPIVTGHFDATYRLILGTREGFHDGSLQLIHTINGQASPAVRPITVDQGSVVRLHIANETDEYHPMHLHGHVLSILARNGSPLMGSPVHQDAILVRPHETWDVAFLADNPGIWMLHCQVPLHSAMGMSMTINYARISTPYEMGTRSGNSPA